VPQSKMYATIDSLDNHRTVLDTASVPLYAQILRGLMAQEAKHQTESRTGNAMAEIITYHHIYTKSASSEVQTWDAENH
jgi:hypothetical protein